MPTAAEVQKLVDLFAPALSAADRGKLAATVSGLDWGRKQPLPQRRFGLAPTTADSGLLRQRLAALAAAVGSGGSGSGCGCTVGSGPSSADPLSLELEFTPDYTAAGAAAGPGTGLRRESVRLTPSLLHAAFSTAAGVAGFVAVWDGGRFGWSYRGSRKLEWTDPSGYRLALAAATAAEPAAAYRELMEWLGLNLGAATWGGEPPSEPEREWAAVEVQAATAAFGGQR